MDNNVRRFLRWLQSQHAPLGHAAPFAASALFAEARFAPSTPLRILAYTLASVFAILIAIDIATELLTPDDTFHIRRAAKRPQHVPLTPFQFVLAGVQVVIYTVLIFTGLGPVTPFIFVIPVFLFSSIVAWRNVRLWYYQGFDFEARLHDLEAEEAIHRSHRSHSHGPLSLEQECTVITYADKPAGPKVPQS